MTDQSSNEVDRSRCAICGEGIEPPITTYNASDDPVHDECLAKGIAEVADALGF